LHVAAADLKATINRDLYNFSVGAYEFSRSFPDVFPQDAQVMAAYSGVADPRQAKTVLRYLRQNTWETFGSEMYSPTGPPAPVLQGYEPLPTGYEILARYLSSDSPINQLIAQQLMHRYWSHQLSWPFGPQSTFWEKQNQEGMPGIGSFTSLAHGWASMPTIALTTYVLGVRPTDGGFVRYTVQPHPGDLSQVTGRVLTRFGPISVAWKQRSDGWFVLRINSPEGTVGRVELPTNDEAVNVRMDGHLVRRRRLKTSRSLPGYVVISKVPRGRHVFVVQPLYASHRSQLKMYVSPSSSAVRAGESGVFRVNVYADGPGSVSGILNAVGPAGWAVRPRRQRFSVRCDGRPAYERLYVYYQHAKKVVSGMRKIYFRAEMPMVAAKATSTVRVGSNKMQISRGRLDAK
jgi:hypothetical protein